ncbi:MAG: class I SAM-dependent methyltransferase [Cellvibrio sp.]|nr:class I SAM-dependent methyltransferase [Cellvibrio sp.]
MKSDSIATISAHRSSVFSVSQMISKKLLLSNLAQLKRGCLKLIDGEDQYYLGEDPSTTSFIAEIRVKSQRFYTDVVFSGSIGAGESYMNEHWVSPDLTKVVRLFSKNIDLLNRMDNNQSWLSKLSLKLFHWFNRNTREGSRKNISAHYDLGNDFYSLFLDSSMMYSSAIYPTAESSLSEAAVYKLQRICEKLELSEKDHLLEIGTGWGGMAIYAAKHYGCKVTTTTISKEQRDYAIKQIEAENLSDKITVLFDDYRDLQGQFSKLVSIEMIEAVGHEHLREYFRVCSSLLKPDGLMLLQSITIPDQRYEQAKHSVDFIQRYIFPGGCLPSLSVMQKSIGDVTDMQTLAIEEIGEDYAQTLFHWRQSFLSHLNQVRQLGFDQRFIRMWEYYLCYCEGGFRERAIGTAQLLLAKSEYRNMKWQ